LVVAVVAVTGVVTGVFGGAAVARADHNHGCGAAVLASRARLLERAVCDLAEGIEDHYSRHPWFVRLLQESQTLSAFTRRYVHQVATDPNPACLLAEIQNVCDQFHRTERLMNAIGVPACVRTDLARVDAVIERIERDLQPVRGRSFPAITNGVGAWTPDHGRIFGWRDEVQPAPAIPQNGGFVPQDGLIVPAPDDDANQWRGQPDWRGQAPVRGPVLRAPAPVDYRQIDPRQANPRRVDPRLVDPRLVDPRLVDPRQGSVQPVGQRTPVQIGVQFGNMRFSIPVR
jgi:hypothetical protein